jgi:hypothetical protein
MSVLRGGPSSNDTKTEDEVRELMAAALNKYRTLKPTEFMTPEDI